MINYKYGEFVTFRVRGKDYKYKVLAEHLHGISGDDSIWMALSLNTVTAIKKFCEKAFGYTPEGCCGDSYKREDYAAASRLIKALEEKCAEETYHNRKPEEVTSCKDPVAPTIGVFHVGRPEEITSRPPKDLKYKKDDKVVFNVRGKEYIYKVCDCFLGYMDMSMPNDTIFEVLDIERAADFCTKAYGYAANPLAGGGAFPECMDGDIAALNRVIEALQTECDRVNALHEAYGYGTPSKEFMEWCKRWDDYAEEKDNAKDALLTVRKSNTCKF